MKVDGLTLLDNTTVTRALSENVGEAFPLNPTDKDTWELKSPIIGYAAGIYIYSVGLLDWFPQNRTESNPNDIAVYLADKPRSNSDVCNINVVRTIYIEPDFAGSLATCRDVATTDTLMNIGVVRSGVLTPLAVLTFKAGATTGIIDTLLLTIARLSSSPQGISYYLHCRAFVMQHWRILALRSWQI